MSGKIADSSSKVNESPSFVNEILEKRGPEVENLYTMSQLAKAGLDRRALAVVLDLIENGIDAESIAQGNLFSHCYTIYYCLIVIVLICNNVLTMLISYSRNSTIRRR